MQIRPHLLTFLLFTLLSGVMASGASVPDWVEAAVKAPTPEAAKEGSALVLLDKTEVNVTPKGLIEETSFQAVRILKLDGRSWAEASIHYNHKADKVKGLRAWLIAPDGKVTAYKDRDFYKVERRGYGSIYTDYWLRVLNVSAAAKPGTVLAWTYTKQERTFLSQRTMQFRRPEYVVHSEFKLTVPPDWRVTSIPVNDPEFEFVQKGQAYTWKAVNQPAFKMERWRSNSATTPYLGINIYPSEKDMGRARFKTFESWNDVARYLGAISDAQVEPDDAIHAKVEELTGDAGSLWEKIQRISHYVQQANYVSINLNLSEGGGYKSFPAATVFSRNYGDCKDMMTLHRAMLSCIGVRSYGVVCLLDTSRAVHTDWPSPIQFNHAIVAFEVPEDLEVPGIVEHPQLGRLLIFDPTNPRIPVGYLSSTLEYTDVLIKSRLTDALISLPEQPRQVRVTMDVELDDQGGLKGELVEASIGTEATGERELYRGSSRSDYEHMLNEWLRKETRTTRVLEWSVADDQDLNELRISLQFAAPGYSKQIGRNLLIFKPFMMQRYNYNFDQKEERTQDIVISRRDFEEVVKIKLPAQWEVDELPPSVTLEESFAEFEISYVVEEGYLIAKKRLKLINKRIPAQDHQKVVDFFNARAKAEQSRVVLSRKA